MKRGDVGAGDLLFAMMWLLKKHGWVGAYKGKGANNRDNTVVWNCSHPHIFD